MVTRFYRPGNKLQNISTFLPLLCLPATKTPRYQKNKLNKNAHTSVLPFYGIDILANDLFYFHVALNLRL